MPTATPSRTERLLRWSLYGAIAFAVLAVVWGLVAGSRMILFDGLFSLVSVVLSGLSLLAYRAVQRGPDPDFPYGREALGSLVLVVKGAAIGVLCVAALGSAALDLLSGGREVELGAGVLYALVATLGCGAMVLVLRRGSARHPERSGLLAAESAEWGLDTLLSAAVLAGFLGAVALDRAGRSDLAAYVDPLMVSVLSVAFLVLPVRLIRDGLRGTLAAAPEDAVRIEVERAVREVAAASGASGSAASVATFGHLIDATITLRFDPDTTPMTLPELDRVRAGLDARLAALPYPLLVTVTFTADPELAEPHRLTPG
jgi:predicted Co/Zn/Cd cation transporter (cation efflux family)